MKKYKTVLIYTDPIKKFDLEGEAYLVKKIWEEKDLEYWKVEFVNDGHRCLRFIKKELPRQLV